MGYIIAFICGGITFFFTFIWILFGVIDDYPELKDCLDEFLVKLQRINDDIQCRRNGKT